MKRNSLVLGAVLAILAFFGWAGWANFEFRKQAAERLLATAAEGAPEAGPASDGPSSSPCSWANRLRPSLSKTSAAERFRWPATKATRC